MVARPQRQSQKVRIQRAAAPVMHGFWFGRGAEWASNQIGVASSEADGRAGALWQIRSEARYSTMITLGIALV